MVLQMRSLLRPSRSSRGPFGPPPWPRAGRCVRVVPCLGARWVLALFRGGSLAVGGAFSFSGEPEASPNPVPAGGPSPPPLWPRVGRPLCSPVAPARRLIFWFFGGPEASPHPVLAGVLRPSAVAPCWPSRFGPFLRRAWFSVLQIDDGLTLGESYGTANDCSRSRFLGTSQDRNELRHRR